MKHCLQILLITDNETILDQAQAQIPAKLDSKMWVDEYKVERRTWKEIGQPSHPALEIEVRFNDDADMRVVKDWMKTKGQQVAGQLLTGSYVKHHVCDHDNPQNGCPTSTIAWSK